MSKPVKVRLDRIAIQASVELRPSQWPAFAKRLAEALPDEFDSVLVQPRLLLDDGGEDVDHKVVEAITVPVAELGAYPAKMKQELKDTEAQLNGSDG